jgi:hypothetical protein
MRANTFLCLAEEAPDRNSVGWRVFPLGARVQAHWPPRLGRQIAGHAASIGETWN